MKFFCSFGKGGVYGLTLGDYDTIINIHNPSFLKSSITLVAKFVEGQPMRGDEAPPQTYGVTAYPSPYVMRWYNIGPDAVGSITCNTISDALFPNSAPTPTEGFVVLYSSLPPRAGNIDVWATYSTQYPASVNPPGITIVPISPTPFRP